MGHTGPISNQLVFVAFFCLSAPSGVNAVCVKDIQCVLNCEKSCRSECVTCGPNKTDVVWGRSAERSSVPSSHCGRVSRGHVERWNQRPSALWKCDFKQWRRLTKTCVWKRRRSHGSTARCSGADGEISIDIVTVACKENFNLARPLKDAWGSNYEWERMINDHHCYSFIHPAQCQTLCSRSRVGFTALTLLCITAGPFKTC